MFLCATGKLTKIAALLSWKIAFEPYSNVVRILDDGFLEALEL